MQQRPLLYEADPAAPVTIHPGETQSINVTFAPAATQTEFANLVIRSNDNSQPSARYSLSGNGTSTFGNAPVKVYMIQESAPLDNTIGTRLSVVNTSSAAFAIGDHRLTYYYYDPFHDLSQMVWNTYDTTVSGTVGWNLRKLDSALLRG